MTSLLHTPIFVTFATYEVLVIQFFRLNSILCNKALPLLQTQLLTDTSEEARQIQQLLSESSYTENPWRFYYLQQEMYICRTVDNFHVYLNDMLRAYFRAHPSILPIRKQKKSRASNITGWGKILDQELEVRAILEAELLVKGLKPVLDALKKEVGLSVDIPDELFREANLGIAMRNILVHNRGRSNERFIQTVGDNRIDLDTPMMINPGEPERYQDSLVEIAKRIDIAFIQKCGMEMFAAFRPFPTFTEGVRFVS
jgi:hypothetical protein